MCEGANGQACKPANMGSDCSSGFCSGGDDVCCKAACPGPCGKCAGGTTCGTLAEGSQGGCPANEACNAAGVCEGASGQMCKPANNGGDCASGFCSGGDDFCCNVACTGPCAKCAGGTTCGLLAEGSQGACPANQACNAKGACEAVAGQACKPANNGADCDTGFCSGGDDFCCNVACAGPCAKCAGGTTCGLLAEGSQGACPANEACNAAGACEAVNGQACKPANNGADCASGNCSGGDDFCCNVACAGPCASCKGGVTCGLLAVGSQGGCPANEECNAAGACVSAPCTGQTDNNCVLTNTNSGQTDTGTCANGYMGACSFSCLNGTWTQVADTCVPSQCATVNGVLWCKDLQAGRSCDTLCTSLGFGNPTISAAAWFAAQNTQPLCTQIGAAFGLTFNSISSYTYACAEYSAGSILCSNYANCPTDHLTMSDGTPYSAICPCD
jgi:hypothetical protein